MEMHASIGLFHPMFLNLDSITTRVRRAPTVAKNKGDATIRGGKSLHSFWKIALPAQETLYVSDAIKSLRKDVATVATTLCVIAKSDNVELRVSCAVYRKTGETTPAIWIDKDTINWLAEIGAVLDIDLIFGVEDHIVDHEIL